MFFALLIVTFAVALGVCWVVARLFTDSVGRILGRLVADELSAAWHRYVIFALYVVGISRGVRLYDLQQYVLPRSKDEPIPLLTPERWTLEVYRTIIETLQGVAWMLLLFFLFALIAYVIVRGLELRRDRSRYPDRDRAPTGDRE
ncbi:MAG: hypothetical protein ACYC2G_13645 [Gemmatimonadaceae bacterium]